MNVEIQSHDQLTLLESQTCRNTSGNFDTFLKDEWGLTRECETSVGHDLWERPTFHRFLPLGTPSGYHCKKSRKSLVSLQWEGKGSHFAIKPMCSP